MVEESGLRTAEGAIGSLERAGLALVYGGPVSWWVTLARVLGVRVQRDAVVSEELLAIAESGARRSARWFSASLVVTAVCMTGVFVWALPASEFIHGYLHEGYNAIIDNALARGSSDSAALGYAGAAITLVGVVVGLVNAAVFGGIPLYFLKNTARAAAPAVSVAMVKRGGGVAEVTAGHPRVALAVETILARRRFGQRPG